MMGDGSKRRAASQGNRQDKGGGVPLPFTEASVSKAISELKDGARLAVSTCLDLWRDKKFGTDEFVSFMKCYADQSPTLARVFQEGMDSSHSDSTGGSSNNTTLMGTSNGHKTSKEYSTSTSVASVERKNKRSSRDSISQDSGDGSKSERGSASLDTDGNRSGSGGSSSPQNANGSSPHTMGSDSEKGFEKGYMGSASESNGHSSRSRGCESGSNGCESSSNGASASHGNSSRGSGRGSNSGDGSCSGEQRSGSDSGGNGKGNSPTCNSPNEEDAQESYCQNVINACSSKARKRKASTSFTDSNSLSAKEDVGADPGSPSNAVGGVGGGGRGGGNANRRCGSGHAQAPTYVQAHTHSNKRSRHSSGGSGGNVPGNLIGQPQGSRGVGGR